MDRPDRNYVACELPKAGLGNVLFPLLKAFIFAHLNNLPVIVTGYHRIKVGPFLRREKTKRRYGDYFIFQKNFVGALVDKIRLIEFGNFDTVEEPSLRVAETTKKKTIYRFRAIPNWRDYFKDLKEHRKLAISILWDLLRPAIKERVQSLPSPVIGVHIRMGDFRRLQPGEDFSKVGITRTPLEYFSEVIMTIRETCGEPLPVSIFTDGYKHELSNLLTLGGISIVEGNKDIEDMLLLSRSKIIVTSAHSTFGYWAGFLSEAPVILHKDHIHEAIRKEQSIFEGPLESGKDCLLKAIKRPDFSY